ncbi:MBOAT, membrane-bound O-acyltransferase family-domain-containing protein, partial [Radiomyces spectabilis]|uniref:MBOAT, membrane-bound O-acyltransferase family-domain-containing protein n=1 Tax=Radiomyces spectabilis TaxID=64574 RepID=UPI002220B006
AVCSSHIDRQLKGYVGDSQLDYSGALMVLTIKLSSFGFNVLDGRTEDRYLTEYNQRMKIARYPTLIEFFGWAFFFGGFLTGPVCEYMDYIRFTNLPLVETAPNESKKPVSSNLSTWKPAMFVLTKSIILVIILVLFAPTYNYYAALEPAYLAMPFYQRFFFLQACGFMTRVKYYSVWVMAEGACVLCGLGFSGINSEGKPQWDRLRNVRIRECETAPSVKYYTENWNMKANIWLRHYVYLRLTPPGAKPAIKNTFCVYAISAMWHGFHPGYYRKFFCVVFFIPVGVYQTLSRSCRRLIRPLTLEPDQKTPRPFWKSAYDVVGWFFTYTVINFLIGAFDLLYISRILHIWRGIYYYHLWGAALLWGFYKLSYPFFMKLQKQRLQASEKAEDKKLSDLEVKTSQTMRKRTLKAE